MKNQLITEPEAESTTAIGNVDISENVEVKLESDKVSANEKAKAERSVKPWEMKGVEFVEAVGRGKLHQDTGKDLPGEETAKTPISLGEINKYSYDDIAYFYAKKAGLGREKADSEWFEIIERSRKEIILDAITESRTVPQEVIDDILDSDSLNKAEKNEIRAAYGEKVEK